MELELSFFRNKKVFLTGNTGFKGSWITLILNELGALVYGYSLKTETNPNMYEILNLENTINQTFDDIRNYDALKNSLKKCNPDIIIHFAAQPLVRDSYENPKYTYETNVMGTVNLLDIAKELDSLKSVLVITSDKSYRNNETDYAYIENDSLGGHDPYSNSKACADLIASSYYNSFFSHIGVGLAIARAGNIIGGGDWSKDRIIPDAVRAFSLGKTLEIRNPDSVRPWQYILDPLFGYLSLIKNLSLDQNLFSGPWNFGPSIKSNESVKYVCDKIINKWGNNSQWVVKNSQRKLHEANLLMLNSGKASEKIKWSPKYDTNKAINKTIDWYKRYYREMDMLELTIKEIEHYYKNYYD